MLNDSELIPLCHTWARRFLRQAKHLGSRKDAFNELVNEAYVTTKGMNSISGASTHIMWALARIVRNPDERILKSLEEPSKRTKKDSSILVDKRYRQREHSEPSSAELERKEQREKLLQEVDHLSWEQKKVIHLYYDQAKTFVEIGEITGFSREWARRTHNKALDELRKRMKRIKK